MPLRPIVALAIGLTLGASFTALAQGLAQRNLPPGGAVVAFTGDWISVRCHDPTTRALRGRLSMVGNGGLVETMSMRCDP
jgi:hypothetical protein